MTAARRAADKVESERKIASRAARCRCDAAVESLFVSIPEATVSARREAFRGTITKAMRETRKTVAPIAPITGSRRSAFLALAAIHRYPEPPLSRDSLGNPEYREVDRHPMDQFDIGDWKLCKRGALRPP